MRDGLHAHTKRQARQPLVLSVKPNNPALISGIHLIDGDNWLQQAQQLSSDLHVCVVEVAE